MDTTEEDINVAFDSVVGTEERLSSEGFREGFETGLKEGAEEGFHLGFHRGAELGAELGYYAGVAEASLSLGPDLTSDKVKQSLKKLIELIDKFPKTNVDHTDILAEVDSIRVAYKRACSLLKISSTYPEASKLSF